MGRCVVVSLFGLAGWGRRSALCSWERNKQGGGFALGRWQRPVRLDLSADRKACRRHEDPSQAGRGKEIVVIQSAPIYAELKKRCQSMARRHSGLWGSEVRLAGDCLQQQEV